MSAARGNLQEALCHYTKDTLSYIYTLKEFTEKFPEWIDARKTELRKLRDIRENSGTKSFEELKKELAVVLKDTLGGLEKLDCLLDAVERLAVTSLHVFSEENRVLPKQINPDTVQVGIIAAQRVCPLLLVFKRDRKAFFLPKLQNVEVLEYQLDKYIQSTQKICDKWDKIEFHLGMNMEAVVDLDEDLSEDNIQRMLYHINQLEEIRIDQHFRMVFLFKDELCCRHFISEFDERQPRMQQFLNDLEESAVQLDRMNKGAKISSVAGSSVGAVGSILSIIGLALIPVTAGTSLALTMTGVGLGITSGVNSAVTTATEIGVNYTYRKKASQTFQSFMEDVQSLQDCLDQASSQTFTNIEESMSSMVLGAGKVLWNAGCVRKKTKDLVDVASAMKILKNKKKITDAGQVLAQGGEKLCNIPSVASEIPDIGQAAVKGPLALTKSARVGFIAANTLFLGMDIFFICKDSVSLAKGSETDVSKFIRARAALWSSETDSWQKICNSLCQGLLTSKDNRDILEKPIHPEG